MKNFLTISFDSKRIFGLDIVRAAAIFFVMLLHAGNFVPEQFIPFYKKIFYDGVGVFFVLSGFLIGGILIKQVEKYKFSFKSLLHFWVKRWSRTLPNYFLFLAVLLLIEFFNVENFHIDNYLKYFVFSQNLNGAPSDFFLHSWSLSVEEWFYLTIPMILFIISSTLPFQFKYNFITLVIAIILSVNILRGYKIDSDPSWNSYREIFYGVIYRFDAIMYGMLGAYVAYYFPAFWNRNKYILLCIASFFFASHFLLQDFINTSDYRLRTLIFTVTSITVLLSLPYFSNLKDYKGVWLKPITYFSLISYSLYLVNSILVTLIEYLIPWEYIISFFNRQFSLSLPWGVALLINYVLVWTISIIFAIIVYKYFEIKSTEYLRKKINIALDRNNKVSLTKKNQS